MYGIPRRWDQRLFTLVVGGCVPKPLVTMTEATGGRHWHASFVPEMLTAAQAAWNEVSAGGVVVRLRPAEPETGPCLVAYLGVQPSPQAAHATQSGAANLPQPSRPAGSGHVRRAISFFLKFLFQLLLSFCFLNVSILSFFSFFFLFCF